MPVQRKKKLKHSYYLITINTNESYYEGNEKSIKLEEATDRAIMKLFNEHLPDFVKVKVNKRPTQDGITEDLIENVKVDYGLERGNKQGRLHVHATLLIDHRSCLWIDSKSAQKVFVDLMSEEGIELAGSYVNYKLMENLIQKELRQNERTAKEVLEAYLNKDK